MAVSSSEPTMGQRQRAEPSELMEPPSVRSRVPARIAKTSPSFSNSNDKHKIWRLRHTKTPVHYTLRSIMSPLLLCGAALVKVGNTRHR
jgi:hypothetical protein